MYERSWLKVLALTLGLAGSAFGAEKPVIKMATDGALPPYIATGPDGELFGYEADLAADLCRRLNASCQWIKQSFDGAIPALQRGRFDVIMASLSTTAERRKVIDFSVPYLQGPTGFMAPQDSPFRAKLGATVAIGLNSVSPEAHAVLARLRRALQGATVGIERASTHEAFMTMYFKDAVKIRTYGAVDELVLDLANGRLDLGFEGLGTIDKASADAKSPGKRISLVGPTFKGGVLGNGVALGLRKGNDRLRQQFDQAIREASRDGTIRRLSLKWFGFDGTPLP